MFMTNDINTQLKQILLYIYMYIHVLIKYMKKKDKTYFRARICSLIIQML